MPTKPKLVIWGASGHALVIADILRQQKEFEIVGFLDDVNAGRKGELFDGLPVLGGREQLPDLKARGVSHVIFGIGDNQTRLRLGAMAESAGLQFATAIHPATTVAANVVLGAGSVVAAGAIINPACRLGRHCIVNTGATVDHECQLGDGVHIGPGAHLGGRVEIGDSTWIGIGAIIRDRIQIGSHSFVGAGALVIKNVPEKLMVYGVPARVARPLNLTNFSEHNFRMGSNSVEKASLCYNMKSELKFKKPLVITDNRYLLDRFKDIVDEQGFSELFTYGYSPSNKTFVSTFTEEADFRPINVKADLSRILTAHDLVISLHCKQIFPPELVNSLKCINIHPGLNPNNRGWFPQVFSIINKLPLGATIHEIDECLDHGPVIDQEEVSVFAWDTSLSAYNRVLEAELRLIRKNLTSILTGAYVAKSPQMEGNVNLAADFKKICNLNLAQTGTLGEFIDLLRATTHGTYRNAYFHDVSGKKVFVTINLEPE